MPFLHSILQRQRFTSGLISLMLVAVLMGSAFTQTAERQGRLIEGKVPAPALKGNLLNDPLEQNVAIYLPPDYDAAPQKRYPAIYLLHGFGGKPNHWTNNGYQGMNLRAMMDSFIKSGVIREMIVVVPNGSNAYQGSFYTNSQVTGNWEDFIAKDLVAYVDKTYRTLARSESRGIAGHSMGGFGSIVLGMKHPEVFGAVYALSPCCLGFEGDMGGDNPVWQKVLNLKSKAELKTNPETLEEFWMLVYVALSAAFSPNSEQPPFFVDYPLHLQDGRLLPNVKAFGKWLAKMPVHMVDEYKTNLMKLRGLFIDYGENEDFSHIRLTSRKFSQKLAERNIPHTFEVYAGGDHGNKIRERMETRVLQFFARTLDFNSN